MNSYKLTTVETQCLASLLFNQKLTDRDAKHCVSTVGLAVKYKRSWDTFFDEFCHLVSHT
ncbi:MAG: hypothetical protein LBB88_05145 [Planctomycetaceae bacterium]|nr:hypothetical protein [Planctomycetaceae bacterium]